MAYETEQLEQIKQQYAEAYKQDLLNQIDDALEFDFTPEQNQKLLNAFEIIIENLLR